MTADIFLFWLLALCSLLSGFAIITVKNPIYSALSLVFTMICMAGLFVTLDAYFLAGVQLVVYAGAVMVLFVMVLMLFDIKKEVVTFAKGVFSGTIKLATVGITAGLMAGAVFLSDFAVSESVVSETPMKATKSLGKLLFTEHVLGFEVLGILLLIIAIGTVALSRSKGGTHDK